MQDVTSEENKERGKKKIKYKLYITLPLIGSALFLAGMVSGYPSNQTKIIEKNAILYKDDIDRYNRKIEEYAEKIRKMKLDDLETFMKVTLDIHRLYRYKTPEKDILGYFRLELMNEGDYGVCRNIADDFTAKLNAINPDYNARNVAVYISNGKYPSFQTTPIVANKELELDNDNEAKSIKYGNHMVTAVDIKEENITLIIDPTNIFIGVLQKDEIHILGKENPTEGLKIKILGMATLGSDSLRDYFDLKIDGYLSPHLSIEELERKYGVDAQYTALTKLVEL